MEGKRLVALIQWFFIYKPTVNALSKQSYLLDDTWNIRISILNDYAWGYEIAFYIFN